MNPKIILEHAKKMMSEIHATWLENETNLRYNKREQLAGRGDIGKRATAIADCTKKKEYLEGFTEVLRDLVKEMETD